MPDLLSAYHIDESTPKRLHIRNPSVPCYSVPIHRLSLDEVPGQGDMQTNGEEPRILEGVFAKPVASAPVTG